MLGYRRLLFLQGLAHINIINLATRADKTACRQDSFVAVIITIEQDDTIIFESFSFCRSLEIQEMWTFIFSDARDFLKLTQHLSLAVALWIS